MNELFAEVITIGDEILYGQITDTNTQFISNKLAEIGIKTIRKSSVGDDSSSILSVLAEATQRANIIVLTGGLGPTKDDITKHTICHFFDTNLVIDEATLAHVTAFFEKRGRPMLDINAQQALVPKIAEVLFNDWGTAPGMWIEKNGVIYISLPGVPYEMKLLMEKRVLPKIKSLFKLPCIVHKMIHTCGVGESFLAQTIELWEDNLPKNLKLAYLPSLGIVKLRLTATGYDESAIHGVIQSQFNSLINLIKPYYFSDVFDAKLEAIVGDLLKSKSKTISTAESCTGGFIAHKITSVAGSSVYFKGSIVAYHNDIKVHQLHINPSDIDNAGAVSETVVAQMAQGALLKFDTDYAIATSGIAGPDGGSVDKPVGTVWIAVASRDKIITKKYTFGSIRENNITLASVYGLKMLYDLLQESN